MNIILIGMRGSGKTTIGKLLAKKLNCSFIETDERIEKKVKKTIASFVSEKGWNSFRNIEAEIIQTLAGAKNSVIATGGGAVLSNENISILKTLGKILYLDAPARLLLERIGNDSKRPFLTQSKTRREDIERTLKSRADMYKNVADYRIDASRTESEIMKNILSKMKL